MPAARFGAALRTSPLEAAADSPPAKSLMNSSRERTPDFFCSLLSSLRCLVRRSEADSLARSLELVSNGLAALHHEFDPLQFSDVSKRVARDGDEVGELALLD